MATFVVTGYNRTRSKCYRPSYTSDLAPIYEDRIQPSRDVIQREYVSTVFQPDSFQRGGPYSCDNDASTDSFMMKPVRQYRKNPQSSGSMLNGIMANRFQTKRKVANNQTDNRGDTRYIDKHTTINNNNNNNNADENSNHEEGLTRKTSLYQEFSVDIGRQTEIRTHMETTEVVKKDNKWFKFEPGTSIPTRLLCPAEGKLKRRCFVLCFVILLVTIGAFVVVSVEGWTYKATGKGFSGKEPILFGTGPGLVWSESENYTDIRGDGDVDYGDIVDG